MNIRFAAVVAIILCSMSLSASAAVPELVTPLPTPANGVSSGATEFTAVGDAVYFFAESDYDRPGIYRWTEAGGAQRLTSLVDENYTPAADLMAFGDKLLFSARVDTRGRELWITDGTIAGTRLVKDIYEGGSSSPILLAVSGTTAYFTASDTTHGRELWATDGTEAGTQLVLDLTGDASSSSPTAAIAAGGRLYFHALDQLWVSDGTAAGTIALATDVSGTPAGAAGDRVLFLGSDSEHGRELWSTDGTVAGTAMLADLNPGPLSSWGGIPTPFVSAGGSAFFFAEDATNGRELWVSDGTVAGTRLIEDVTPGAASATLDSLVASDDGVFFVLGGTSLWFSDGTAAGTNQLASFPGVRKVVGVSNGAHLVDDEGMLWFSDGTVAGTGEITAAPIVAIPTLTSVGSRAAFRGFEDATGAEPWISDGSEAGTKLMGDIGVGVPSGPTWMLAAGDRVFFASGEAVYTSDGTASGTLSLGNLGLIYGSQPLAVPMGDSLLYWGEEGDSRGLWKSDGSSAGTTSVKDFYEITALHASDGYALLTGGVVHQWDEPYAVWRTDGTPEGTYSLVPIAGAHFVEFAGKTYVLGMERNYGTWEQLWVTDGTPATTRFLASGTFTQLGSAGGALYVGVETAELGAELYRNDGTSSAMTLVKDISPGPKSGDPETFVSAGNLLFFTADDGVHGRELWRSDGTEAGTFLLRDIRMGTPSPYITELVASGPYVYFTAEDDLNGRELWRSDGTVAGTIRLSESGSIGPLEPFDGRLMAAGYDGFRGNSLWESDGTIAGTFPAFSLAASARNLTLTRSRLFFTTTDAKLWILGRAASRVTIADAVLREGNSGSALLQFVVRREGDLSAPASVEYATEDLTATAGSDYQASAGTVSFAAGESTKSIGIPVHGDAILEQSESFALVLTGATGVTIVKDRAFGIIEEDDHRVALSVTHVPSRTDSSYESRRTFRITNAGPSAASVTLRVSESPFRGGFSCDGQNPSVCNVGTVLPGQTLDFTVTRSSRGEYAPEQLPGRTLTATVSAFEPEADLSDNTVARMVNGPASLSLPPYLLAGSTATAFVSATAYSLPATVTLSLSGGVIVSPSSVVITEAQPVAPVTLMVPSNAWGQSIVRVGSTMMMTIPIVMQGEPVKLDTAFEVPEDYYAYRVEHGEPVVLPVSVAAVLHDGTRPTGSVRLERLDGTPVADQVLDADGAATFTLTGLPAGSHQFRLIYDGDASFNGLSIILDTVEVEGWWTSTYAEVITSPCGDSSIIARVSSGSGQTPTGAVRFSVSGTVFATVALVPGGSPGVATASAQYSFTSSWTSVYVEYVPDDPFAASYDYAYGAPGTCAPPALIASATAPTAVSLIWSDVGAGQYAIFRSEAPTRETFVELGTTTATSFVDATAVAGKAYLYRVQARTSEGVVRSTSLADLALTFLFTDDPIVFKATPIKALHITQLQEATNLVRTLAGIPTVTFVSVSAGTTVRVDEIVSLRAAITEGLIALEQKVPSWIDGAAVGNLIKGTHVQQLRNALK